MLPLPSSFEEKASMVTTHNLGFPRIGATRELKFALESYWKGHFSRDELKALGTQLRQRHWQEQSGLDQVPVGDFAFYDQVLDMSFTLIHWITTFAWHAVVPLKVRRNTRVAAAASPQAR